MGTEGERKYQTDLGPLELQDTATWDGVQEMFVIAEGRDHLEKQVDTKRTLTLQTPALVLTFAAIVFFWVQVVLLDYPTGHSVAWQGPHEHGVPEWKHFHP